jgi:DNA-binding NarL/FixJ family response regulator
MLHGAYVAGIHAVAKTVGAHRELLAALEASSAGIVVVDLDGTTSYQSPSCALLVAEAPDGVLLTTAIRRVVRHALALLRPPGRARAVEPAIAVQGLTAKVAAYTVHALVAPQITGLGDPCVVIRITRAKLNHVDDATLAEHFQLTPRESSIARAIATGATTQAIAAQLGITVHTVRRHTERVFAKLGVTSRAAVAPRFSNLASR